MSSLLDPVDKGLEKLLIEVSLGEALDKLSILELKRELLVDPEKLLHVQREIETLGHLTPVKQANRARYEELLKINRAIWDLTAKLRSLTPADPEISIASAIFRLNEDRFRAKSALNAHSLLKEQKDYDPPITYVSGGLLGDFIHQLSIVNENYLATGRKGIVYLSNRGDAFRYGLDRALEDLTPIVSIQPYVDRFLIHNGEPFDIDLSVWRQSPRLFKTDWRGVFESCFQVSWGAHQWLKLTGPRYEGTMIGMSTQRNPEVNWEVLLKDLPQPVIFVSDNQAEIAHWIQMKTAVGVRLFPNLFELFCAIGSCEMYVGNMSAPLAAAIAMHQRTICLGRGIVDDVHFIGLEKIWPHFRVYQP